MKHKHAELMMQYAQDAMETDKPWERWEFYNKLTESWLSTTNHPAWVTTSEYRRKPKMVSVTLMDGEVVSWPEPEKNKPVHGCDYFYIEGQYTVKLGWFDHLDDKDRLEAGIVHLSSDAVMAHRDALLKINNQVAK